MSQQDASKTRPHCGLVIDRPTHALVSLTVSKLGCTKLIFIEPGAKINGQCYRDEWLMQKLLATNRSMSSSKTMRRHTSCLWHSRASALWDTLAHQSLWQANSPDLNSVDDCVWDMLQERMYQVRIRNTDELQKRLVATWAEFQQSVVDYAVDLISGKKRLEACICGHFEHLLWRCLLDIPVATHHSLFFSEPPMIGRTQHYLQTDQKSSAFYKVVRWHFSGVVGKGVKVFFFWDNINNLEYVWIILLKMTFLDIPR